MTIAALPASPIQHRIESIDVLRGVAVLGILLLNVRTFALPSAAYSSPTIAGVQTDLDMTVFLAVQLLCDAKFMTIFSILFGAGVMIFTSRVEARLGGSGVLHYRRMGWLLLIGLCHAWLLWWGDILVAYALCGMLVFPLRKLLPRWQAIIGLGLLVVGATLPWLIWQLVQLGGPESIAEFSEALATTPESIQSERAAWGGGWLDQWDLRTSLAMMLETSVFAVWVFWRTLGLMLIGMACLQWRAFDPWRSLRVPVGMVVLGLLVGLPLVWQGILANQGESWSSIGVLFSNAYWNYWGSVPTAFAWIGMVMLLCRISLLAPIRSLLAAVGRMALTNYLAQSLLCGVVFYGWGMGRYEQFGYAQQLIVVAGIWALQLMWSPIWLGRFQFGPVEWLWRTLTYWKLQPFRRERVHLES